MTDVPRVPQTQRSFRGLINGRSVRDKVSFIVDHTCDHKLDIVGITETWLSRDDTDRITTHHLTPPGYKLIHTARTTGRGGEVALLHRSGLTVNEEKSEVLFKSFEYIKARLEFKQKYLTIVVLYRPPPSKKNGLTINLFFDELCDFLERETSRTCDIIIMGDFNVHLDAANQGDAVRLKQMFQSFNLDQHVTEPTHVAGHILDLVLSNSQCDIAGTVVSDLLSDHHAVHFSLGIEKPVSTRQVRLYRKIRSIDQAAFNSDIQASDLIRSPANTLAKLVDQYNSTLSELVDRHAPQKRSVLTGRPDISWMNEDIIAARKKRRQCE